MFPVNTHSFPYITPSALSAIVYIPCIASFFSSKQEFQSFVPPFYPRSKRTVYTLQSNRVPPA
ncbi:hypothetical protein CW304_05065 [Bacillus sp. UFRGS-B20]|nr:hypothetical protein CW304_05065 [Bacillus sp. UFRGS-B20]